MSDMDIILHFDEKIDIPEGCKRCPALAELARHHDRHAHRTAKMADYVVSGGALDGLRELLIRGGNDPEETEEVIANNRDKLQAHSGEFVDRLYGHLDSAVEVANGMIAECPPEGTLKVRARRSGQQIVATFCMSRQLQRGAELTGDYAESVVVERTNVTD